LGLKNLIKQDSIFAVREGEREKMKFHRFCDYIEALKNILHSCMSCRQWSVNLKTVACQAAKADGIRLLFHNYG
jgi:hypothetical protein